MDKAKLFPPALFGIDCAVPLTAAKAKAIAAEGAKFAVRYLVPPAYAWKRMLKSEADAIQTAGLRLASVFQLGADRPKGGAANGNADGKAALAEAKVIGQPTGSAIFMAVDYDAPASDYDKIEAYLRAAQDELPGYHVGVYGHYGVIEEMFRRGACRYFWQTYAWSDGKKSSRADLWQYKNNVTLAGHTVDYNECYDDSIFWGSASREEEKPVSTNEIAVIVNGKELPEKGEVKAGVTRVPARALAEALGAKVVWDKEANAVRITI
ncbi:glycoside hydrolase domain-containing protein [Cohnella cellulosilytica]|uniref:glycoside hydrolase domain-containing protein n=1 Tax=Cohnella cellulosilytica TaxID=986710 RepID=UPI00361C622B